VNQPSRKKKRFLVVPPDDHPVGGQLMGSDPTEFAPAARALADAGYDVIDINFGCPVKKVLGRCRGGFLLSQPGAALDIVRRVFDALEGERPVTVKMRRGMDDSADSERSFFEILEGAFSIGVAAVTVHGRTVKQRYVGPSRWDFLKKVKERIGDRTILGSGDLFSAEACVRMIRETGVDGVTIARGSIGNPWIFEECRALWEGRELPSPPSIARQREAISLHHEEAILVYGAELAGKILRKFGIKYSEHHPHALQVRDAFIRVKSPEGFQAVLDEWYDPDRDWPAVKRRDSHGDLVAAGATL
jgi:nifR3 family TIM-barrel protein